MLVLESGRRWAPWGSKSKEALPGTVQNVLCSSVKENSFTMYHLTMQSFFFFSAFLMFISKDLLILID